MNLLKKIISFIYPINIKTIPSERSGTLEVTLNNGKLVIDSENANYSYGSLQKVLKKGLLHIGKDRLKKVDSILVLGVAGGSVIQTLRDDFELTAKIAGIEIDPEVIALANTYFQLHKIPNLELISADAFQFIQSTKTTYDLIIIDIFNDSEMPSDLFENSFWNMIHKILNNSGLCLFNSIYTSTKELERNKILNTYLKDIFNSVDSIKSHQINELFVLKK